jgi:hypothetical protein
LSFGSGSHRVPGKHLISDTNGNATVREALFENALNRDAAAKDDGTQHFSVPRYRYYRNMNTGDSLTEPEQNLSTALNYLAFALFRVIFFRRSAEISGLCPL